MVLANPSYVQGRVSGVNLFLPICYSKICKNDWRFQIGVPTFRYYRSGRQHLTRSSSDREPPCYWYTEAHFGAYYFEPYYFRAFSRAAPSLLPIPWQRCLCCIVSSCACALHPHTCIVSSCACASHPHTCIVSSCACALQSHDSIIECCLHAASCSMTALAAFPVRYLFHCFIAISNPLSRKRHCNPLLRRRHCLWARLRFSGVCVPVRSIWKCLFPA